MGLSVTARDDGFQSALRHWRQYRKLSQLDLALSADVSQRHVSWLETGRSQPSRAMILRLCEAMDIPLRERNALLMAAGFAAVYQETALDKPIMEPVLNALTHVLSHHDPFPAFVVDRFWNIKMSNRAAETMFNVLGDIDALWDAVGDDGQRNLALLTLHPQGLRSKICNWALTAPSFIRRLEREALSSGSQEIKERTAYLIDLAGPFEDDGMDSGLLPILPLELMMGELKLSVFSVISTFGTPQDLTTDELRVEAFYPADTQTEMVFRNSVHQ